MNFPSQVIEQPDGRLMVSHLNNTPSPAPLLIKARKRPRRRRPRRPRPRRPAARPRGPRRRPRAAARPAPADELHDLRIAERSFQDREIVYFLKQPETHAFSLYHDYTESRPGVHDYVNVVRAGSTVSDPSAVILDTGEKLETKTLEG